MTELYYLLYLLLTLAYLLFWKLILKFSIFRYKSDNNILQEESKPIHRRCKAQTLTSVPSTPSHITVANRARNHANTSAEKRLSTCLKLQPA